LRTQTSAISISQIIWYPVAQVLFFLFLWCVLLLVAAIAARGGAIFWIFIFACRGTFHILWIQIPYQRTSLLLLLCASKNKQQLRHKKRRIIGNKDEKKRKEA
jgi:hypothetical protein